MAGRYIVCTTYSTFLCACKILKLNIFKFFFQVVPLSVYEDPKKDAEADSRVRILLESTSSENYTVSLAGEGGGEAVNFTTARFDSGNGFGLKVSILIFF